MSLIAARPPGTDVEYPEGPRVPEGDLQTRRRMELVLALRDWLPQRHPDPWVCCDINVYFREGDPSVVIAPDVAVAFGVDAAAVRDQSTYKVWEAGAVPTFVLEIASPNTFKVDLEVKPRRYAELGAIEYWRLDPTGGDLLGTPLAGERRPAGRWEPIAVSGPEPGPDGVALRGRSDVLGLDLCWIPPKLRLWDPAGGVWLLDYEDLAEAHRASEARAANASAAGASAASRARAAESRADRESAARAEAEGRADRESAARAAAEDRARQAEAELAALRRRLDEF